MRFFTADWHRGRVGLPDHEEAIAAYEQHLGRIRPVLPATVRVLANELHLAEGRVRRVVLDRAVRELRFELRAGSERGGWFDLDLTYLGAVLDAADVAVLAAAARDSRTLVAADEVDVAGENTWLHRFLFWPYRDCEIMFRALALRMAPRADGSVPFFPERFVESGS